jgi:hypothetical protein
MGIFSINQRVADVCQSKCIPWLVVIYDLSEDTTRIEQKKA